ncbi:MFS transporter, partial [Streptomyces sp. SID2119]|nr:MFS transporter [Streptomyces sp. SID2119]
LIAVAALPLLAGMGPEAYRDAGEFAATFRRAMPMCAGLLVLGAVIACWTVRTPPVAAVERKRAEERPECTVHCGIVAPPLEPERAREGER